jgi:hypothetical protein
MEVDRFDEFKRELEEIVAQPDALRERLQELLRRYEIPELTGEYKTRARKCKARLAFLRRLSEHRDAWDNEIAGRMVRQWGGSYREIYMCPEMDTFQLKTMTYQNGNSRYRIPETSFTYCKLISPAEFVDLIAGPLNSEKSVDE